MPDMVIQHEVLSLSMTRTAPLKTELASMPIWENRVASCGLTVPWTRLECVLSHAGYRGLKERGIGESKGFGGKNRWYYNSDIILVFKVSDERVPD